MWVLTHRGNLVNLNVVRELHIEESNHTFHLRATFAHSPTTIPETTYLGSFERKQEAQAALKQIMEYICKKPTEAILDLYDQLPEAKKEWHFD